MNETELAKAIATGAAKSPQRVGGFMLWSLRLSGTGPAYRAGRKEYYSAIPPCGAMMRWCNA